MRIEPQELAVLLNQHSAHLALYAAQWTRQSEDCVQESFVELATQTNRPTNPIAWLYSVVRNRAINQSRSDQRRKQREQQLAKPDWEASQVDHELQNVEQQSELVVALDSLSRQEREWVILRIWSGLTWDEIASITSTSSSSAQRNYASALKKMRTHLESKCLTNPD
ncbi:MAG: sigma-70 family RNA polymerase sigma factor [Planctomycetota bacterium]